MGGLTDEVEISMSYGELAKDERIMDFNTRQYEELAGYNGGQFVIRKMKLVMSSGILAANPGSQTGELLVGYPFSAVSTSQSTESMLLKLRVYLGSVLYRPENILILPHIAFEGVTSGHEAVLNAKHYIAFKPEKMLKAELEKPVANMHKLCKELTKKCLEKDTEAARKAELKNQIGGEPTDVGFMGFTWNENTMTVEFKEIEYNAVICRGSKAEKANNPVGYSVLTHNTGHLGCIDSPHCADRIWGTAGGQVYKDQPGRV